MIPYNNYSLSKSQALIWNMEKYAGGSICIVCGSMLHEGMQPISVLENAANQLLKINDGLRLRFHESNGQILQYVSEYVPQQITSLYFNSKADLDRYGNAFAKIPLNLSGNLFDIKIVLLPGQYGFLVKLHHLISDAWTLSLLATQINGIIKGVSPNAYSYIDALAAEKDYLSSKRYEKDRAFFLDQFAKCDEVTYISEKKSHAFTAGRKSYTICADDSAKINEFLSATEHSAFTLFLGVLATYISRIKMNSRKFYIGTAVLNRNGIREKNTAGMFINTIPLLMKIDSKSSFLDNLVSIEESVLASFKHQKFNYGDTLAALRSNYNFRETLYDVSLSYQNATISGNTENMVSTWYHCGMQTESLQIHIDDRDSMGVFRVHYDYLTEKFNEKDIDALHTHLVTLLFDAISYKDKKLCELNILTSEEKHQILCTFNATARPFNGNKCIHSLINERAHTNPDCTAIVASDSTLTMSELIHQANRIANALIRMGIGVGDVVAFSLPRKSYLVSTMLGILKAGAAYMPIDSAFPKDRIELLLKESCARYYITDANIQELIDFSDSSFPTVPITPDSLCYCISTSGSTGTPKIVLINHENIVNTILWKLSSTDSTNIRTISVSGNTTDTFTEDVLFSLLSGRILHLCDREDIVEVARLLSLYPNCAIMTTPTLFHTIWSLLRTNARIKEVTLVGESLTERFVRLIHPKVDIIYNEYGPSECAVCATRAKVDGSTAEVTIGKPIANVQVYILDKYLQPVPIGTPGELCIAGNGVGAGYLNRPDLTASAFVNNPFGAGKLYRTGDLAYWREDGEIIYIGRNDFQVKIRGLRIELEEIENAVASVPGIFEAVVDIRKDQTGRQLICAFYTESRTVDVASIKKHISTMLPKYMLPHIFIKLQDMPVTSSGKVNRKALPDVDLHNITRETEYVKPEGDLEKQLAEIWESVLHYTPVGRNDDFFDAGGDSLKAIEFISKAHTEGIYLNLQTIFDYSTIKRISWFVTNGDAHLSSYTNADFTQINRLLEQNDVNLSKKPCKKDLGNLLLTGATGFLGMHILENYLCNDQGTVFCLVRGKTTEDSINRFTSLLEHYFGDKYSHYIGNRIQVLCADLQLDLFGLSENKYKELVHNIQTVINTAASVKHYGSYQYFYEVNVQSVMRLVDFCNAARAKLIHASTVSVSGLGFEKQSDSQNEKSDAVFSEKSLYIGQTLENVYARSKFEAEKVILEAKARGLQACIMRMGNLTNRRSDGKFQKNYTTNAFLKRIKGIIELGAFPENMADTLLEFTPIDEAADAVMTIARHPHHSCSVFHILNHKFIPVQTLLRYFADGQYPVKLLSSERFAAVLKEAGTDAKMAHILESFINDMDGNGKLHMDHHIHVTSDFTINYLQKLGFEWKDVGSEYIQAYLTNLREIGFLEV